MGEGGSVNLVFQGFGGINDLSWYGLGEKMDGPVEYTLPRAYGTQREAKRKYLHLYLSLSLNFNLCQLTFFIYIFPNSLEVISHFCKPNFDSEYISALPQITF